MELLKRLKLIETCISLQDHALIELQLPLLKTLGGSQGVDTIIDLLEQHYYVQAQQAIEQFLNAQQGVVLFDDAQISAIRLELSAYEQKLQALLLRRNEAQNRLQDFNREYHLRLGGLLMRILSLQEEIAAQKLVEKLRRYHELQRQFLQLREQIQPLKLQRQQLDKQLQALDFVSAEYGRLYKEYSDLDIQIDTLEKEQEEARQEALKEHRTVQVDEDYQAHQDAQEQAQSFEQDYEEVKEVVVARLDGEEARQFKSIYRKACRLSHPDLVSDELKEKAHGFMVEVNAAYAAQDLPRLQDILFQLENDGKLDRSSEVLSSKDAFMAKLSELKARYQQVQEELESYEASAEYQEVVALGDDWDSYFDNYRKELEEIAEQLQESLDSMTSSGGEAA